MPVSWATSIETEESPNERRDEAGKKGLYLLHIDGGKKASAVGEMGEGAIAALLKEPNGTAVSGASLSERIGPVESPTAAEYRALLGGLELARERGVKYLAVFSDSRILVNQLNRLWNVGDSWLSCAMKLRRRFETSKARRSRGSPGTGTRKLTRS